MEKMLGTIERVGNKVPHPVVIFVLLIGLVIVLSHVFYRMGVSVTYESINVDTDKLETLTTSVRSLLTTDGIRFMYSGVVANFMAFTAVGVIIVAMLGVGVAEAAGLIAALIHKLVTIAPARILTYILVFVGILSSIAADAGYLVLIPLAAAAYASVGRNPLVGLAASFAAVAAVFSVNIFVKPLDGILVGLTNDAIENHRFDVSEIDRFGLVRWIASFVRPTRIPSSGLTKMLTLKTAATAAKDAARPTSGLRPTLAYAAAASGISTR